MRGSNALRRKAREGAQNELLAEVLSHRAAGNVVDERRVLDELLKSFEPLIRRIVKRFPKRGTLLEDDLLQSARMAVVRCFAKYDPLRGNWQQWAYQHAVNAVDEIVRRQSADVHVSEMVHEGRIVAGGYVERSLGSVSVEVVVEQRKSRSEADGNVETESRREIESAMQDPTPEDLFSREEQKARLYAAINRLPQEERELVRMHFGLSGQDEESIRTLHIKFNMSRAKATSVLKTALGRLARIFAR